MKTEFLQNLKVGDQPLSKEVIDAIMAETDRASIVAAAGTVSLLLNRFKSLPYL